MQYCSRTGEHPRSQSADKPTGGWRRSAGGQAFQAHTEAPAQHAPALASPLFFSPGHSNRSLARRRLGRRRHSRCSPGGSLHGMADITCSHQHGMSTAIWDVGALAPCASSLPGQTNGSPLCSQSCRCSPQASAVSPLKQVLCRHGSSAAQTHSRPPGSQSRHTALPSESQAPQYWPCSTSLFNINTR